MIWTIHQSRGALVRPLRRTLFVAAAAFALAACGGGGGGGGTVAVGSRTSTPTATEDMDGSGTSIGTYTQFNATTAGMTSALQTVAVDNKQAIVLALGGTLDHATGTIKGGALAGDLNEARTELTLTGGGTVTLSNPAATEYVRFFQTSGAERDLFGVVGTAVLTSDMPDSGSGIYNGVVIMEVANDDGSYQLTGDSRISATWNSTVDTLFDDLSRQLNSGSTQNVSGSIGMTGATISGTAFSGGVLQLTGSIFSSAGSVTATQEGQFFGKNADEVGGVFTLNADDLKVSAVFAGE